VSAREILLLEEASGRKVEREKGMIRGRKNGNEEAGGHIAA